MQKKFNSVVRYLAYLTISLLLLSSSLKAKQTDSLQIQKDSIILLDTFNKIEVGQINGLLEKNFFFNRKNQPFHHNNSEKNIFSKDALFYFIIGLLLSFGLFRMLNNKYFINIARIFFNSTLRQSQLVDQLLQAKLPSLYLNLFFVAVSGFFIFLSLFSLNKTQLDDWRLLLLCMTSVMIIYTVKFITLKFFGWLVDCRSEADNYIFIVFLLNKILGILLLPMIFIMAFADNQLFAITMVVSCFTIGIMFLLRYFRTYNSLRYNLKVSRLHFALYVIGIEILPIFLIYKQAMIFLIKKM